MEERLGCCLWRNCGDRCGTLPKSPVLTSWRSFFALKELPRVENLSLVECRLFPEVFSEVESVWSCPEGGRSMSFSPCPPRPLPLSCSYILFLWKTVRGEMDSCLGAGETDLDRVGCRRVSGTVSSVLEVIFIYISVKTKFTQK